MYIVYMMKSLALTIMIQNKKQNDGKDEEVFTLGFERKTMRDWKLILLKILSLEV